MPGDLFFIITDDLTAFNDGRKFEKSCKEMYHPKSAWKKGSIGNQNFTYKI